VADETTTQQDTTTSETATDAKDASVKTSTEQQVQADAAKDSATADEADTSVLGGEVTDEKPADAKPVPPEKYELVLTDADGKPVELDADALAAADPVFRELGLDNDQANKLMPVAKTFAERTAQATIQQIIDAGAQQKADWLAAYKSDPEIGGAKAEETEHLAAKALDALGYGKDHTFRKALTESGFGNHPDMIRAFRKMGELVSEDGTFARPQTASAAPKSREEVLYGAKE
jgi:hypothetical protein